MPISITLCNYLFEKLDISKIFRKNKKNVNLDEIIDDINILLADENVERKFVCNHVLNKLIQLTNSEYGFIGRIIKDERGNLALKTKAVSNMAWNSSSYEFWKDNTNHPMIFKNMNTHFGEVITKNKSLIFNKYDKSRKKLPKGHPMVKRFVGIVSNTKYEGRSVLMVGLCNKSGKRGYTKNNIENVQKIIDVLSYLMINIL